MNQILKGMIENILNHLLNESGSDWKNAPLSDYKSLEIDKRGSFGERLIKDAMTPRVRRIEYNDGDQGDWDLKIENKKLEIKTSSIDKSGKFQNEGLKKYGNYDAVVFVGVEPEFVNIKCVKKENIDFDKLNSRENRKTGVGHKWDLKKSDMTQVNTPEDIFNLINNELFDGKLKK